MGPILASIVSGIAAAGASSVFAAGSSRRENLPSSLPSSGDNERTQRMYGEGEVGADEIYIEGEGEDEVGAAKKRPRPTAKGGAPAWRRTAFIPATSIAAASTAVIPITLNAAFKGIGLWLSGTNQDKLLFNGATIRGIPQEASSGSIGCEIFTRADQSFFWEWDTANPGESFSVSFTNTHTAAVTPTGWLIGYKG